MKDHEIRKLLEGLRVEVFLRDHGYVVSIGSDTLKKGDKPITFDTYREGAIFALTHMVDFERGQIKHHTNQVDRFLKPRATIEGTVLDGGS